MLTNYELLSDARGFLGQQLQGIEPGDDAAQSWDEFFAIYDGIIRRFARAAGVRPDDLDECVQDVWVAVIGHLETFQPDPNRGRFRTWLYQVVRNKATDRIRLRARTAGQSPGDVSLNDSRQQIDVPDETPPLQADPLERLWKKEALIILLDELEARVSADSYRVFEGRALQGQSYEEIAERMGANRDAIRTRFHRTREVFRRLCHRYAVVDERKGETAP